MRQGIIIFAAAPERGSPQEAALVATVEAALKAPASTPFVAYAKSDDSEGLRALVGGPPPRFFPQANRTTLGERIAQALAFLFVQGYDRVLVATAGHAALTPERFAAVFATLEDEPVAIEELPGAYLVALRREDFPRVAPAFEEVAWEEPGARAAAERLLSESGAKA